MTVNFTDRKICEALYQAFKEFQFPPSEFPQPKCENLTEVTNKVLRLRNEYFPSILSELLILSIKCERGRDVIDDLIDILDFNGRSYSLNDGSERLILPEKKKRFEAIGKAQSEAILGWLEFVKFRNYCPPWRAEILNIIAIDWEERVKSHGSH
jgi:hypothetical protein